MRSGRHGLDAGVDRPNTIGLGDRTLDEFVRKLDADPSGGKRPGDRAYARWPFVRARVPVSVMHPGGTETALILACRNLSRGGIGLLHSAFLYPGSKVTVTLAMRSGREVKLPGSVLRCVHRVGTVHEIGVAFDHKMNLHDFVRPSVFDLLRTYERVDPSSLTGLMVLIEPSPMHQKVVRHYLEGTLMRVRELATGAAATPETVSGADLILCEQALPDEPGAALIKRLRGEGVGAPIVLIGEAPPVAARAAIESSGCSGFLAKPFGQEALLLCIAEHLLAGASSASGGEGEAPAAHGEELALITDRLQTLGEELEHTADNPVVSYAACVQIKSLAERAGATALAEQARDAAHRLAAGAIGPASSQEIKELARACRSMRPAA